MKPIKIHPKEYTIEEILKNLRNGEQYFFQTNEEEIFMKYDSRIDYYLTWTKETYHPEDNNYYLQDAFMKFLSENGLIGE